MIELKKLSLENFLLFPHAEVSLDNQGLVFLSGDFKSEASASANGTGKSSILSAVSWVLFGEVLKDVENVDKVINYDASLCQVKLSGEIDGHPFTIIRERKKNGGNLFFDLAGSSRKKDVQEEINEIFGTFDLLKNTIILSQRDAMSFVTANDSTRKAMLEDLFKLKPYRSTLESVRQDINFFNQRQAEFGNIILSTQSWINETIQSLEHKWSLLKSQQTTEAQTEVSVYESQIEQLKKESSDLTEPLKKISWEFVKYDSLKKSLEKEVSEANENKHKAELNFAKREGQLKSFQSQIASLNNKECPTCGEAITDSNKRILHLKDEAHRLESDKEVWIAELQEAQDKSDKAKGRLDFVMPHWTASQIQLQEMQSKENSFNKQMAEANNKLKESKSKLSASQVSINAIIQKDLELHFNQLIRNQKQVYHYQNLIKKIDDAMPYLKFWEQGFSHRGLPSFLIEESLPIVCNFTNDNLKTMTDNRFAINISATSALKKKDATVERLSFIVNDYGREKTFGEISEGEQRRIVIALFMALAQTQHLLTNRGWNIRMIDELFNSLDETGKEKVITTIHNMKKEVSSIIIVSNDMTLRDSGVFDKFWVAQREGESSKLLVA